LASRPQRDACRTFHCRIGLNGANLIPGAAPAREYIRQCVLLRGWLVLRGRPSAAWVTRGNQAPSSSAGNRATAPLLWLRGAVTSRSSAGTRAVRRRGGGRYAISPADCSDTGMTRTASVSGGEADRRSQCADPRRR
jgi:hypothetical protein